MDKRYNDLRTKLRKEEVLPESYSWENFGEAIAADSIRGKGVARYTYLKYLGAAIIVLTGVTVFFLPRVVDSNLQADSVSDDLVLVEQTETQQKSQDLSLIQDKQKQSSNTSTESTFDKAKEIINEAIEGETSTAEARVAKVTGEKENVELAKITTAKSISNVINKNSVQAKVKTPVAPSPSNVKELQSKATLAQTSGSHGHQQNVLAGEISGIVNQGNQDQSDVTIQNFSRDNSEKQLIAATKNNSSKSSTKNTESTVLISINKLALLVAGLELPERMLRRPESIHLDQHPELIGVMVSSTDSRRLSVELSSGVNYWTSVLRGPSLETASSTISEVGLPSFIAGIGASYQLNNSWSLSAGIQYSKNTTKLDYYDSRDTILVRNLVSVPATAWDKVVHYNSYTTISIPIAITRNFALGEKLQLGIGVGGSYDLLTATSGKTLSLDSSDHRVYTPSDLTASSLQNSGIGLMTRVELQRQLGDRSYLGLELKTSYSMTDLNPTSELMMQPLSVAGLVKLGYKL